MAAAENVSMLRQLTLFPEPDEPSDPTYFVDCDGVVPLTEPEIFTQLTLPFSCTSESIDPTVTNQPDVTHIVRVLNLYDGPLDITALPQELYDVFYGSEQSVKLTQNNLESYKEWLEMTERVLDVNLDINIYKRHIKKLMDFGISWMQLLSEPLAQSFSELMSITEGCGLGQRTETEFLEYYIRFRNIPLPEQVIDPAVLNLDRFYIEVDTILNKVRSLSIQILDSSGLEKRHEYKRATDTADFRDGLHPINRQLLTEFVMAMDLYVPPDYENATGGIGVFRDRLGLAWQYILAFEKRNLAQPLPRTDSLKQEFEILRKLERTCYMMIPSNIFNQLYPDLNSRKTLCEFLESRYKHDNDFLGQYW